MRKRICRNGNCGHRNADSVPADAAHAAVVELPDYRNLAAGMANGGSGFDDQGNGRCLTDRGSSAGELKAVHLSSSGSGRYSRATTASTASETFSVMDTGGKKYQDDGGLCVAGNTSDGPDALSLTMHALHAGRRTDRPENAAGKRPSGARSRAIPV